MVKKNYYIDDDEFFEELCLWQDFEEKTYWENILKEGIKEAELGIQNVKIDNEDFYKKREYIHNCKLNKSNLTTEQKTELQKIKKEVKHREILINKRIKEYEDRILDCKDKIEKVKLTPNERTKHRRVYNEIGLKIKLIIDNFAIRTQYRNYPFLEDMKMLAMEHCIKGLKTFNRNKKNSRPFMYFTFAVWRAFLQEIKKEKDLLKNKFNYVKNFVSDAMLGYDYNDYSQEEDFTKPPIEEDFLTEIDNDEENTFLYE